VALQDNLNATQAQLDAEHANAAGAAHARDALRVQLNAYVRAYARPSDPAASAAGTPAGDPVGVLADVLDRADARAGELADFADRSRIAGLACERAYDALTSSATEKDHGQ